MKPTIKKIAEVAGVTHATVSMVLNKKPGPSSKMREKITKIAKELGYVPNINARNLAKKESNNIGLFLLNYPRRKEDRIFYYYMEFFQDIMIEARKRGYTLLFFTDEDGTREKLSYFELCVEQNLKSAIFLGMDRSDENYNELKRLKDTQVILFDIEENEDFNTVISDSSTGIKEMFLELEKMSVKKLAVVKGLEKAKITTQKKINEIDRLAKKHNIVTTYYQGDFFKESGYRVGKVLNYKNYDAIFAMNDAMAVGVIEGLSEREVNIPDDISVIGFDNLLTTELLKPKLTTIAHDNKKIIEEIFNIVRKKSRSSEVLVPTNFIKKGA